MNLTTRITALAGVLVLAVSPTACATESSAPGAGTSSPRASSGQIAGSAGADATHNDVDVAFTQHMVVHHEGAVAMADLAVRDASTPQVKALGQRIGAAQVPEIAAMTSWLEAWGEESPADAEMDGTGEMDGTEMEGMDMDEMGMDGMDMGGLSQAEAMSDLDAADGAAFDRRFLELMIQHHRGAIEMAESELAGGSDPQALELAQVIIDAQNAEIIEMGQLLKDL